MSDLSDEILFGTKENVARLLGDGTPADAIDAYGYTPLIEAVIVNKLPMVELLLAHGASPDFEDLTGATPIYWAADSGHYAICELLLKKGADPNRFPISGQAPLVFPLLRDDQPIKDLLYRYGANLAFAQDYIQSKLLAHRFEVGGGSEIVDHENRFIEIAVEGFYLDFTLILVQNALMRFKRHYVARELKPYFLAFTKIIEALGVAARLRRFKHFSIQEDIRVERYDDEINALLQEDLLIIPVSYEGHAITCLQYGDYFAKCDRGEHSKNHPSVLFYKIGNPQAFNLKYIKNLIYGRHDYYLIHKQIEADLCLRPIENLNIPTQLVGNCSWANVEATIPAALLLFWLNARQKDVTLQQAEEFVMQLFDRYREWDKDCALEDTVQSYYRLTEKDIVKRAAIASRLAAVLTERLEPSEPRDVKRAAKIIPILCTPDIRYILDSYLRVYCNVHDTPEGQKLRQFFHAVDIDLPRI